MFLSLNIYILQYIKYILHIHVEVYNINVERSRKTDPEKKYTRKNVDDHHLYTLSSGFSSYITAFMIFCIFDILYAYI